MGQRMGIAAALLGRPRTIVIGRAGQRPGPGRGPWIRALLRTLAEEGCTVFYSSHLMSEMAQTAKNLIVIGRGRLIADGTVEQFIAATTVASVVIRSPQTRRLRGLLDRPGARIATEGPDLLRVDGITPEEIGTIALQAGVPVFDLRVERASLEDAFSPDTVRRTGKPASRTVLIMAPRSASAGCGAFPDPLSSGRRRMPSIRRISVRAERPVCETWPIRVAACSGSCGIV